MRNKLIIISMLIVSSPMMFHIGAGFAGVDLKSLSWFQIWEISSMVLFVVIEGIIAHDSARLLAVLSKITKKKRTSMESFVWRFHGSGLLFLFLVFPIAGTIAWIGMPTNWYALFAWGVAVRATVPVAIAMHGMSMILLPKAPSKPKKSTREQVVLSLFTNNKSPINIADEHNIPLEEVEIIQNELSEKFN